jgi:hypothetical protein
VVVNFVRSESDAGGDVAVEESQVVLSAVDNGYDMAHVGRRSGLASLADRAGAAVGD